MFQVEDLSVFHQTHTMTSDQTLDDMKATTETAAKKRKLERKSDGPG